MPIVIGVQFRDLGRLHLVSPGSLELPLGERVLLPTSTGLDIATVVQTAQDLPEEMIKQPVAEVVRIATDNDLRQCEHFRQKESQAFGIVKERIAAHKLEMKLVKVEYAFDGSKLIASFTSGGRVDFRALVKDLAGIFKTRIELRQIGVRDEAKMITGIGSCGRSLCCSSYLNEFQPVSIKMAKEQNLSLNPTKISGVCGRLMCCLKYEQEQYEKSRKKMPKLGKEVITPQGRGIVTQMNALLETVTVRITHGDNSDLHVFQAEQVTRVNPPQQQKQEGKPGKQEDVEVIALTEQDEEFMETLSPIIFDDDMPLEDN